MIIEYLCKNYDASEKLKTVIDKKVQKLDKFFDDDTRIKIGLKKGKRSIRFGVDGTSRQHRFARGSYERKHVQQYRPCYTQARKTDNPSP